LVSATFYFISADVQKLNHTLSGATENAGVEIAGVSRMEHQTEIL